MSNETFKSDPALYREMSVPPESVAAASEAARAFVEAVSAARRKHRIRDVLVVAEVGVACGGAERDAVTLFSFGNQSKTIELAAYAYGAESEAHARRLSRLASGIRGAAKESEP